MQVSVESPTTVEKRVTVIIPPPRVEQALNTEITAYAKQATMKGFRPGKVPVSYIQRRFAGEKDFAQQLRDRAIQGLIQETLQAAIAQVKLRPISSPKIETKATTPSLEYVATFEVMPEVGTVHFALDSIEKKTAVVQEEDVNNTLERLKEKHVIWAKVDRAAEEKDKIKAKIELILEDGTSLTKESVPIEFVLIDQPTIFGWLPKEKLMGCLPGDHKNFTHTLPAESLLQSMAGKTLEFKIEILEVNCPELPEFTSDFIKSLGIPSGELEALRGEIRKQLEFNLKRTEKSLLKESVFEKLMVQNPMDLPASLIAQEAKHLHDENCSTHGQHQHSPEDQGQFQEIAKKRLLLALLVGEVVTRHKLTPSPERIDHYIADLASAYEDPENYIQKIKADKQTMKEIESAVLEQLVVEKLLENVTITEKEVSYQELINGE